VQSTPLLSYFFTTKEEDCCVYRVNLHTTRFVEVTFVDYCLVAQSLLAGVAFRRRQCTILWIWPGSKATQTMASKSHEGVLFDSTIVSFAKSHALAVTTESGRHIVQPRVSNIYESLSLLSIPIFECAKTSSVCWFPTIHKGISLCPLPVTLSE